MSTSEQLAGELLADQKSFPSKLLLEQVNQNQTNSSLINNQALEKDFSNYDNTRDQTASGEVVPGLSGPDDPHSLNPERKISTGKIAILSNLTQNLSDLQSNLQSNLPTMPSFSQINIPEFNLSSAPFKITYTKTIQLIKNQRCTIFLPSLIKQEYVRHQNHENQENLEESHISTSSSCSQSRTGAPHDTALKNFTQKPLQKTVRKNAKAKELFLFCIESLQIEEPEYFGLYYLDRSGQRVWLTLHKSIADQLGFLKFRAWNFHFGIKHYPKLNGNWGNLNKTTFEIMYCNIREDVASGHLPASFVAHVLLGSLAKKIDGILFGQNPENRQDDTLKIIKYAPNQTEKLNSQISALYERKNDLTLFEAMVQYVEYASKLQMFGIQLFLAKVSRIFWTKKNICLKKKLAVTRIRTWVITATT